MPGPPIGEAFVRIRPDFSVFAAQTAAGVTAGGVAASAAAAGAAVTRSGAAARRSASGWGALVDQSNLARGAFIGVSRVTPVTVFGLGAIGTAAIVAATAVRAAIGTAAGFEQQLNIFQSTAQATEEEMVGVAQEARNLGRDLKLPGVSSVDAAVAMTELAKAGLDVEQSIAAANGVLQLATAANIDAAAAANITANTLNAFALEGEQAAHVADLLAAASIAAQGSISDMGLALLQSEAVAHQLGISVEDTVTLITELAHAGLQGSDAGTSLRTTLLRLTPTTREAANFVEALGIKTTDANGQILDAADIFEQYRVALAGLTDAQRQLVLAQIFGQDAIRAASILAREGRAGYDKFAEATNRTGVAAQLAAARSKGLSGAWAGLTSNAETLAATVGASFIPSLTGLVEHLSLATDQANDLLKVMVRINEFEFKIPEPPKIPVGVPGRPGGGGGGGVSIDPITDFATRAANFALLTPLWDQLRIGVGLWGDFQEAENRAIISLDSPALNRFLGIKFPDTAGAAQGFRDLVTEGGKVDLLTGIGLSAREQIDALDVSIEKVGDTMLRTDAPGSIFRLTLTDAEQSAADLMKNIDALVKELNGLRAQGVGPESTAFQAQAEALEQQLRNAIKRAGTEFPRLPGLTQGLIESIQSAQPIIADSLSTMIQEIIPGFQGSLELLPKALTNQIELMAKLGPGAQMQLGAFGNEIAETIATGIKQSNAIVAAAEKALDDAIDHMQEAIREAVTSGKENMESLADSLVSDIEKVVDVMPFGIPRAQRAIVRVELQAETRAAEQALRTARDQGLSGDALQPFIDGVNDANATVRRFGKEGKASLETIQGALEQLQARLERRRLAFSLRSAQRELRDARDSVKAISDIAGVEVSPGQQRAIDEFLDPFQEGVADVKGQIQTFSLEQVIGQAEKTQKAFKTAATQGVLELVDAFNKGEISADALKKALENRLGPVLKTMKSEFGKNLGFRFTEDFQRTLDNIIRQAQLLTGFLSVLGTEPGQDVVDIPKVVAAERARVKTARENLEKSLEDQKRSRVANEAQVRLLAFILAALNDPTPKTRVTQEDVDANLKNAKKMVNLANISVDSP